MQLFAIFMDCGPWSQWRLYRVGAEVACLRFLLRSRWGLGGLGGLGFLLHSRRY